MEGGLYYSAYCDCDGEASTDNDGFGCGGDSVYLMSYSCGVEAETACPSNLPITPDSLETIENKVKIKFIERAEKKSFGNEM